MAGRLLGAGGWILTGSTIRFSRWAIKQGSTAPPGTEEMGLRRNWISRYRNDIGKHPALKRGWEACRSTSTSSPDVARSCFSQRCQVRVLTGSSDNKFHAKNPYGYRVTLVYLEKSMASIRGCFLIRRLCWLIKVILENRIMNSKAEIWPHLLQCPAGAGQGCNEGEVSHGFDSVKKSLCGREC